MTAECVAVEPVGHVPRQQFVDVIDFVVSDVDQDVFQVAPQRVFCNLAIKRQIDATLMDEPVCDKPKRRGFDRAGARLDLDAAPTGDSINDRLLFRRWSYQTSHLRFGSR